MPEEPVPTECYLCEEPTDSDQHCYGCKQVICNLHPGDPWGDHDPEDHDEEGEEEE